RLITTKTFPHYRLKIVDDKNVITYSKLIAVEVVRVKAAIRLWPNPAVNDLHISFPSNFNGVAMFSVINMQGAVVQRGQWAVHKGTNDKELSLNKMLPGMYQLSVVSGDLGQPISCRFVKQ
ncbi:MAG TPA: T9SS type A sorting domain-containing protein, partial [Chitinophagaceae bacterium]|nr:T9SS type A sorting domain-containing protein [Chitinophagaceae bacterium]